MRKKHDFATLCEKFKSVLLAEPSAEMDRTKITRKLHLDSGTANSIATALALQGDLKIETVATQGRMATLYKLLPNAARDTRLETIGKLIEAAVKLAMQGTVAA
jgi:hypothetical protein